MRIKRFQIVLLCICLFVLSSEALAFSLWDMKVLTKIGIKQYPNRAKLLIPEFKKIELSCAELSKPSVNEHAVKNNQFTFMTRAEANALLSKKQQPDQILKSIKYHQRRMNELIIVLEDPGMKKTKVRKFIMSYFDELASSVKVNDFKKCKNMVTAITHSAGAI